MKLLPDQNVQMIDPAKQKRHEQRVDGDADLHQAVSAQRLSDSLGEFPGQRAAEREATHERCEHSADGERRRAENEPQHPRPEYFVDQSSSAGEDEAQTDQKIVEI